MAEKNRFSKPVAFNHKNAEDQLILNHVKRRNFSGYVKKLILADIRSREGAKPQNEAMEAVKKEEPKKEETAAEKMARMKEQLKNPSNAPGPKIFNQ